MDYFGLKSLKDLPKPKDFKEPDSQIGEQAPIEETVSAEAITTQEDIPTSSE
jgi:segregation and condensation protein B